MADTPYESFMDDLRNEWERAQAQLREIELLVEHSQAEVNKLNQRNTRIATRVRHLESNFDTVPRQDIKTIYEDSKDARQRLVSMRGQLDKLQSDQNHLQHLRDILGNVISFIEGADTSSFAGSESEDDATNGDGSGLSNATIVRVVEAQESERKKLARQMHDGPAQSLTNFILQAEICGRLFERNPDRAVEELNNLKAAASGTFQKVRAFIFDLRPMMLDDLGLVPTVRRYVEAYQTKNNINTQISITGEDRRLESHREVMIFRGVQELLTNARDHAQATQVKVLLDMGVEEIIASVEDNGKGFDVEEALRPSSEDVLGVGTLKERIELVGGHLEIISSEGEGSKLTIRLAAGPTEY